MYGTIQQLLIRQLNYFAEPKNVILNIPFKVADVPYKCGGFEGDKGFNRLRS